MAFLLGPLCGVECLVSNSLFKGYIQRLSQILWIWQENGIIRDTFSKFIPILWVRQSIIVKGCS